MARVTLRIVLTLLFTIVLAWGALGLLNFTAGTGNVSAFTDDAPRALFGLMGIALALWTVLLIIGAIVHRHRGVGWRIGTSMVSLVAAIVVNMAVFAVLDGGGWGLLILAIAAATGVVLLVSGVVAVLIVELAIVRSATPVAPAAPAETVADEVS